MESNIQRGITKIVKSRDLSRNVNQPFPYATLIGNEVCLPDLQRLNTIWIAGMNQIEDVSFPYEKQLQFSLKWACAG